MNVRFEMISLQIFYEGNVQGVGFRWTVRHIAKGFDVTGWVRNRLDGNVEAVFAGPSTIVAAMIEACWRGPPSAHVDSIDQRAASVNDLALRRPGELFSVLRTA